MFLNLFVSVKYLMLSQKQKYYLEGDKLLPVIKDGFLRSEENVHLNDFQNLMVYECWCPEILMDIVVYNDHNNGRCCANVL